MIWVTSLNLKAYLAVFFPAQPDTSKCTFVISHPLHPMPALPSHLDGHILCDFLFPCRHIAPFACNAWHVKC